MDRRRWALLCWLIVAGLPALGRADSPSATPDPGAYSADLIAITPGDPSVPLRHGGVVTASERIELGGRVLKKDADYSIDYSAGVVYLMQRAKAGDVLSASYRYSKTAVQSAPSTFGNGINSFQLSLLPGAVQMKLGFGMAERTSDGTVMRSNLFGWDTNLKFGSGANLGGLLLFGDRSQVSAESNFEANPKQAVNDKGKSRLILENLSTDLGHGGKLSLKYQDISKNFTGFSAATGYNPAAVQQLQKEKGLTRYGIGLSDAAVGSMRLSSNFNEIKDDTSEIMTRSLGLKQGGLSLGWSSQAISSTFSRFGDLAEGNRADLKREAGTRRDSTNLGFDFKGGSIKGTGLTILDSAGGKITRHDLSLTGGKLYAAYGDSDVEKDFGAFANLPDPEKASYSTDAGLHRRWSSLKYDFKGNTKPLQIDSNQVKSDTGSYRATDLSLATKSLGLTFIDRGSDPGFASFAAIKTPDTDANINAIGTMYGQKPNAAAERANFALSPGVDRRYLGVELTPFKAVALDFGHLGLKGATDSGSYDAFGGTFGGITASYKREGIGQHFDQLGSLMGFEKGVLGSVEGLNKTDLSVVDKLSKTRTFTYDAMNASTVNGGAEHSQIALNDPKLQVSLMSRGVDPTFTSVAQIADTQAGLLNSLIGFKQSDDKVDWNPGSGLKYDGEYTTGHDATTGVGTMLDTTSLTFDRKGTSLGFITTGQRSNDPTKLLLENMQDRMYLKQAAGNWTFHAEHDKVDYGGTQELDSAGKPMQSFANDVFGVDAKISKTTSLSSELTNTTFADGEKASIRTDSVSTEITPRAGITLSHSSIDNNADQHVDETKHNYGFWYDITKGLRLSYGYVRDLNANGVLDTGTSNSVVSLGAPGGPTTPQGIPTVKQGVLSDFDIGGGYGANQWSAPSASTGLASTRTQSFSNVKIGTIKPLAFGPVKDFKLAVNTDTAADNLTWIRQNQQYGFSGKIGSNTFGFDYHGQVDTQGERAVDRTYKFTTDPSDKRFFTGGLTYKIRALPNAENLMVRNFDFTFRPIRRLSISNQLATNPEVANPNVILGSATQGTQLNRYKADYKGTKDTIFGASWEEQKNAANNAFALTSGVNLTLFATTSPLSLFYGWQNVDGNVPHQTINRWSLKFDQRAGPNQSFSFLFGSLSYGATLPTGIPANGFTAQVSYTLRM